MKSLNRLEDSLLAYGVVLRQAPWNQVARNGKASVLILLEKPDEAMTMLSHHERPRTNDDWIAQHMVGMVHVRAGRLAEAQAIFQDGLENGPPLDRDYFRLGLATVCLRQKSFREVLNLMPLVRMPKLVGASRVLTLHAQCALGQKDAARETHRLFHGTMSGLCMGLPDAIVSYFEGRSPANQEILLQQIYRQEVDCQLAA
ncbi:MAG: hypothetical protein HW380_644 [Magnetococcales bacterium]|nr:hypothetical protein [Magnetococcales bacterium]